MMIRLFFMTFLLTISGHGWSQIENVIIEKYYISNADDETDTLGGRLEEGTTTYRLFLDMKAGTKLVSIYGNENHPLIFSSTAPFFNHLEEGISFGKDLNRNRYGTGTVPLDTYITLGQCSRPFSQTAYFGIPKSLDPDGSVVGGVNNDGGSEGVSGGLLVNNDPQLGLPLTTADGLSIQHVLPESWVDIGFKDIFADADTTIFGSELPLTKFYSTNALLRNAGTTGADSMQNIVLLAQLTTRGEITFEINVTVEIDTPGSPNVINYVARNDHLDVDDNFEPLLSYPYECGCTDPGFLEASTEFACEDNTKCITPVVYGCTDSNACNFNPQANFNIPELCCYIGYCHDLDISLVCPDLPERNSEFDSIYVFPNPATETVELVLEGIQYNDLPYRVSDMLGRKWIVSKLLKGERAIDVASLSPGLFVLTVNNNGTEVSIPFVKI